MGPTGNLSLNIWPYGELSEYVSACRNEGYGSGAKDNPIVFHTQNYTDILLTNFPGHSPVIEFDGAGGISMTEMSRVEISGGISNWFEHEPVSG